MMTTRLEVLIFRFVMMTSGLRGLILGLGMATPMISGGLVILQR
jgi:hypothetical protein